MTKTEASLPSRYSSMRILAPAAPNFPAKAARTASSASSRPWATVTPLPAAAPSALITTGYSPNLRRWASAAGSPSKASKRAVGTPAWFISSLAKIFEPSIRAAALEGPKTLRAASQKASAIPPIRGDSGPTTVRSISFSFAWSRREIRSSAGMSATCAMRAMPGLPGAAYISGSRWLVARASTSACSRPPLPTTITRTALGPDPLYYRLIALRSDADHAQGDPDLGLHEPHEVLRGLGQIAAHPASRYVHSPAGKLLVEGAGVVQVGLAHGELVHRAAVYLVADADLYLLDHGEHVEERDGEVGYPVQGGGVLDGGEVKPADPARPARGPAVLVPRLSYRLAGLVEELRREGAIPHPGSVRLGHPDYLVERHGRDAAPHDGPAYGRVRGGDEGVRAMVVVQ